MKKSLIIGLILCAPVLLSAQQKGTTQQDLQKQIEALRKEMQSKISALQDSVALLQQQLQNSQSKQQAYGFFYQNPNDEKAKGKELEDLLRDHAYSYNYQYKIPEYQYTVPAIPPYDYDLKNFKLPKGSENYFEWKSEAPECQDYPKHKHHHEWMKMLPFGNLFKN